VWKSVCCCRNNLCLAWIAVLQIVTFWYGLCSGSVDPYHWLTDPIPSPDPTIFVSDLQDGN
jgi:hypothetical protein